MLPRYILGLTGLMVLTASSVDAADILMTHKNATAGVNTNGTVSSLTINGINYLANQSFYYRVGGVGGESLLSGISTTPTVSFTQIPNTISSLDVTYANANLSVRTLFLLTGGNLGAGNANLSETLTLKNLSGSPLDLHFFQYSDFDLSGQIGGQTATVQFDALLQPYKISQTDGISTITETVNANTAPIGHFETSLGNGLLTSLNDLAPTILLDTTSAGPGNAVFAYQWDVLLNPNETLTISKLMSIVPEPTAATLIATALAAGALFRRKKI